MWLDIGPSLLSEKQASDLALLVRQGLKRRGCQLLPKADASAVWVVQVRAIDADLFVLVASGPAMEGSGISKSRRIDTSRLGPDVLVLSLAQAAEELIEAAQATPAPAAAPRPSPPPPLNPTPAPLKPPPAPRDPWSLRVDAAGALWLYGGGLRSVGGVLVARAAFETMGLMAEVGFGQALPTTTAVGRVAGPSLEVGAGPFVHLVLAEDWALDLSAMGSALWLGSVGSEAAEGLMGRSAEGWALSALFGAELGLRLGAHVGLSARAAVGPVLRGLVLEALGERLFGATGVAANFGVAVCFAP
ncbi:MAG: hypothetical protein U1E65_12110 [Myxococcota bacterium]